MSNFDQFVADFEGKKILIFGLGLLGSSLGDALLFHRLGCPLRITDLRDQLALQPSLDKLQGIKAEYILTRHRPEDIEWADIILRSAAIPWNHPLLDYARQLGKPIHMDVELFVRYGRGLKLIGVTGTRGKTTTTSLISNLLTRSGLPNLQGGNLKDIATLPLLESIKSPENTYAVLELSSWQLQSFHQHHLSPQLAVVTNLYPDHLNVYPDLKTYYHDKQAIYLYQEKNDHVFFNTACNQFQDWSLKAPGQVHWYASADLPQSWHFNLLGNHNRENLAAAYAVARFLNLDPIVTQETLTNFKAIPHRLQFVRNLDQVTYINDTTATTPVATENALRSLDQPIVLILGGSDKKLPIESLAELVNQKVDQLILLKGNGTDRIKPLLSPNLIRLETDDLRAAIHQAKKLAQPGSVILFSPGFTSFGLFLNEYHRGESFIQIVNQL